MTSTSISPRSSTRSPLVAEVVAAAAAAQAEVSGAPYEQRAGWLESLADELDANADELVPLADEETALGNTRLSGELARTSAQLRLFASVVREGSFLEAIIDHRNDEATPPIPDLRRMLVPVGPVAVFAASNFPFAFSVLGGDTASALAAGNTVVVKAHEGHPELSRRVSELAQVALSRAGAPAGDPRLGRGKRRRRRAGRGPADHGRRLHRLRARRARAVRRRQPARPPHPLLRRAGQPQPGGGDARGGDHACRRRG